MKMIGLIGGMSWESSALYYRLINEETKRCLGGHHNAPSLMATVDLADVERLQHGGDWKRPATLLPSTAQSLERGGADFIVLCTNTMPKLAQSITLAVQIPLLHIVDATAATIRLPHSAGVLAKLSHPNIPAIGRKSAPAHFRNFACRCCPVPRASLPARLPLLLPPGKSQA